MPKLITSFMNRSAESTQFTNLDDLLPSMGNTGKDLANAIKGISRSGTSTKEEMDRDINIQTRPPREAIEHIIDAISRSRKILDLQYDWDDAGSPRYSKTTWERMKNFLLASAEALWLLDHRRLDAPKILPGPDGSIDIHWKSNQRELLINIAEEISELAHYYGDNKNGQIIKGTLNISVDNQWLLLWLMQ